MTLTALHRWAIEVDQDRLWPNLDAQRDFIRDFGKELYGAMERLPAVHHVYFTRIFAPERDSMGAYVRLHFFLREPGGAAAAAEISRMLLEYKARNRVFKVHKETIDGVREAAGKGAEAFPELYYAYVEGLSRAAVQMFWKEVTAGDMCFIAETWRHNLFNLLTACP